MAAETPQLPGEVRVARTADALYDDLAGALVAAALAAVQERGVFHLALSGGATPEPFYMRLMIDPGYRVLPWSQTHLWQVDERRVPAGDARRNWRLIRETLADHIPARRRQLHPMPVEAPDAAALYEADLRQNVLGLNGAVRAAAAAHPARLDFVLLGVGADGHTASLFPESAALDERTRWVAVNEGPTVAPPARLTLTFPLLNAARRLALLATGQSKAAILRRIQDQLATAGPDPRRLPVTGLDPAQGELSWWLDAPAAGTA